jgi:hypothetical protein
LSPEFLCLNGINFEKISGDKLKINSGLQELKFI